MSLCPCMLVYTCACASMCKCMGVCLCAHAARIGRVPFRLVRMMWDVAALSIGFMLGSTVGIATLITGFFLGPMITCVARKIQPFFA